METEPPYVTIIPKSMKPFHRTLESAFGNTRCHEIEPFNELTSRTFTSL